MLKVGLLCSILAINLILQSSLGEIIGHPQKKLEKLKEPAHQQVVTNSISCTSDSQCEGNAGLCMAGVCDNNWNTCKQELQCATLCGKLKVHVSTVEGNSGSWELKSRSTGAIVMSGQGEGDVAECVDQNDSYNFTFTCQNFVEYKLWVNDVLFIEQDYFAYDEIHKITTFICSSDSECTDESNKCTVGSCNTETKQCIYEYAFSESCRSFGKPSLVTIFVDAPDKQTPVSEEDLSDFIYGTYSKNVTLSSQYEACSFGKFTPTPFIGTTASGVNIDNGVTKISISTNVVGIETSLVVDEVVTKAEQVLGDLETQFDFVLLCLPEGTVIGDSDSWKAYAFVNAQLSVYNGDNCKYLSVLMHEIGHNLGLSHSNDEANYGDLSGFMGISFSQTEGPKKCFNGAKYWDLGWLEGKTCVYDARNSNEFTTELAGIAEQHRVKNNNGNPRCVLLKIENALDSFEYILFYNRRMGMNSETGEGADKVLLLRQKIGLDYRDSKLVTILDSNVFSIMSHDGDEVRIYAGNDYGYVSIEKPNGKSCEIDDDCIDLDLCTVGKCESQEYSWDNRCVYTQLTCEECGAPATVKVNTNDFPMDLTWNIQEYGTERVVFDSGYHPYANHDYNSTKCLPIGIYLFSINYSNNKTKEEDAIDFFLDIGEENMDNGTIVEEDYIESLFIICSEDSNCFDFDGCSVDFCNKEKKICENVHTDDDTACSDCSWLDLRVKFDNFPEETKWGMDAIDFKFQSISTSVLSGDPYPFEMSSVFGRRKAPTKSGRRKAPTRAGRRKAPTRSGRRKAPTRSINQRSLLSYDSNIRTLETDEEDVIEEICLQRNFLYHFYITDTFGDGICCAESEGYFALKSLDFTIVQGGDFKQRVDAFFILNDCSSDSDCILSDSYTGKCFQSYSLCVISPKQCNEWGSLITMKLNTGRNPLNVDWKIMTEDKIVLSGGRYYIENHLDEKSSCLPFGIYKFTMTNIKHDGVDFYEMKLGEAMLRSASGLDDMFIDDVPVYRYQKVFEIAGPCSNGLHNVTIHIRTPPPGYYNPKPPSIQWFLFKQPSNINLMNGTDYAENNCDDFTTTCVETGSYSFKLKSLDGDGLGSDYDSFYKIYVNQELIEEYYGNELFVEKETSWVICENDSDCDDGDSCSLNKCDESTYLCTKEKLLCTDCLTDYTSCDASQNSCAMSCLECGQVTATVEIGTGYFSSSYDDWFDWSITNDATGAQIHYGSVYYDYTENLRTYVDTFCFDIGRYMFAVTNNYPVDTVGYYKFFLFDELKVEGKLSLRPESSAKEVYFIVCTSNADCDDNDTCTVDECDQDLHICKNEKLLCADCLTGYIPCDQTQTACVPSPCSDCDKYLLQFQLEVPCTDENSYISWDITDNVNGIVHLSGEESSYNYVYVNSSQCLDEGSYTLLVRDAVGVGLTNCNNRIKTQNFGETLKLIVNEQIIMDEGAGFSFSELIKQFQISSTTAPTSALPTFSPSSVPSQPIASPPGISIPPTIFSKDIFEYFIEFDRSYFNETFGASMEYIFEYNLAKEKSQDQFSANILDQQCNEVFDDKVVVVAGKEITATDGYVDKGIVRVKFNETDIEESDLWQKTSASSGELNFCLYTELKYQNLSISYAEVRLRVRFNLLSSNYVMEGMDLDKNDATAFQDTSISKVEACICEKPHDESVMNCVSETFLQNSLIHICVQAPSGLQIAEFKSLILYQDDLPKFKAIENGMKNGLTSTKNGQIGVAVTQLVASFFKDLNPSPITVKGSVMLSLLGLKRNLIVSDAASTTKEKVSVFELEVKLGVEKSVFPKNIKGFCFLIVVSVSCLLLFILLKKQYFKSNYALVQTEER